MVNTVFRVGTAGCQQETEGQDGGHNDANDSFVVHNILIIKLINDIYLSLDAKNDIAKVLKNFMVAKKEGKVLLLLKMKNSRLVRNQYDKKSISVKMSTFVNVFLHAKVFLLLCGMNDNSSNQDN